jgi:glycosyltransferase involved in cell wall biosynthesis
METRPRIPVLHLITRLDRGGSAENTLITAIGLDKRRYQVTLAAGASRESKMTPGEEARLAARLAEVRAAGVELVTIPSLVRRISPIQDLLAFVALVRLIRRIKPAVVHTHTSKAGAIGRPAARLCRVPVVVHTPHGHLFYGYYGPAMTTVIVLLERWLGRLTDGLIALTSTGKMEYLERRIVPQERLHAIHSGVDLPLVDQAATSMEEARRACGLPLKGPLIGLVGRLVTIKGHRDLIEAFPAILRTFPEAQLLFVGEGEERGRLAAQAKSLGVADHLHMVGAQPELWKYLAACDLCVQPSLNEGMGRTVIEAMAMGRPVVASQVGGLPELINSGKTGLLVPPMSPPALAEAICALLRDPEELRRMGRAAQQSVDHRFSARAMVEAIDLLYRRLLQEKRGGAAGQ